VLRDLVAEVDLEDDVVDAALTSEWDEKLRERFDAAQEAGVTGIPTFVYGRVQRQRGDSARTVRTTGRRCVGSTSS